MAPSHIYFIGYRGCGKSAVGRIVADQLGLPCLDTDVAIEAKAGQSIADIFAQSGESTFRDLETAIILETQNMPTSVISLGGGAILREFNRQTIKNAGRVVWLQASPETLATRIQSDTTTASRRPALSKLGTLDEIRSILEVRTPLYRDAADIEIDTTELTTTDVADKVIHWLRAPA